MIARYDLALNTASFDFFTWLVLAAAKGYKEIVFGTEKVKKGRWPEDVIRKRFHSIMEPGPALLGLPHRFGDDGVIPHGPNLSYLVEHYRSGQPFPRLRSVLPSGNAKYTVTLRNNPHIPQRNSNEAAWREFASEIGGVVIPDYDDKPMHLHERMALYAGAKMNFGMVNGPMHLIVLSDYPMMMFGCHEAQHAFEICGIERGGNYPWSLPHQSTVWEPDNLSVIRRHFAAWQATC